MNHKLSASIGAPAILSLFDWIPNQNGTKEYEITEFHNSTYKTQITFGQSPIIGILTCTSAVDSGAPGVCQEA